MTQSAATITRFANKDLSPLSDNDIRRIAPAVFTDKARSDFSERYQVVNTAEIMNAMRSEGFVPVEVQSYRRRDPKRVPYAMHLLRFSQKNGAIMKAVGDTLPQIIVRNSHDGSSLFELYNGFFRLACLNGMIVSDSEIVRPVNVRHSARSVLEAMYAVQELVERQKAAIEHATAMRGFNMSAPQLMNFAGEAIKLRPSMVGTIDAQELLVARRTADQGNDLWHVFNRVQENLIRGGQDGLTATKRKTKVRSVSSIGADLDVNSRLWSLAMQVVIGKASASSKREVEAGEVVSVQTGERSKPSLKPTKGRSMQDLIDAAKAA